MIELFTQPQQRVLSAADRTNDLATRSDVLPLQHVDYWDYLCVPPPLRPCLNTAAAGDARRLAESYVYTPQFVVHGVTQAVGRDRTAGAPADQRGANKARPELPSTSKRTYDDGLVARLDHAALPSPADIGRCGSIRRMSRSRPTARTAADRSETSTSFAGLRWWGHWSGRQCRCRCPRYPRPTAATRCSCKKAMQGLIGESCLQVPGR